MYYGPLTLFWGDMGLGTLERRKPQFTQETQAREAPVFGRRGWLKSASSKLSVPAAHRFPFYSDIFWVHISVGPWNILLSSLSSRIYCIAALYNSKALISDIFPGMVLTIHVLNEGGWWGLGLLLTFLQTPCLIPSEPHRGFISSLAKAELAIPVFPDLVIKVIIFWKEMCMKD